MVNAVAENSSQLPKLGQADLETILSAWENATARLQHTHEVLREEVRRLTDELEIKNRELARKNRLADLGQMASHVAHEVRNGLAPVKLYLSLLRRSLVSNSEEAEILAKAERGLGALETTVTDLLHFTADRDPSRTRFPVRALCEEIVESLAPQLNAQGIDVECRIDPALTLSADREMLRRALLNLVLNAIDAMPGGGRLAFAVQCHDGVIELSVSDSGTGIPDDSLRRIFEPFFTTKSHGTGLGLAIVFRIVEMHGGEVIVKNIGSDANTTVPQGGAVFILRLPLISDPTPTSNRICSSFRKGTM